MELYTSSNLPIKVYQASIYQLDVACIVQNKIDPYKAVGSCWTTGPIPPFNIPVINVVGPNWESYECKVTCLEYLKHAVVISMEEAFKRGFQSMAIPEGNFEPY